MKKRLLFCIRDFDQGGIPKSLNSLLYHIDTNLYDIDIFCADHDGVYKDRMVNYNVLKENFWLYLLCINYRKQRGVVKILAVLMKLIRVTFKKFGADIYIILQNIIAKRLSQNNYDTAIAYAEGFATQLVAKIHVNRRVAWIHINYERYLHYEKQNEKTLYEKFDNIVCPSMDGVSSFLKIYPFLFSKTIAIKNLLNTTEIINLSQHATTDINKGEDFNIISVGRVCYEKRFFLIPSIARALADKNLKFKWYVLGPGPDVETNFFDDEVEKYQVAQYVKRMGAKSNPYPYIRSSDLLVMLSINETFSYVIYEAKIVGTPIVTTDFNAVHEIMDERYGSIVSLDHLADAIEKLMIDQEYYKQIKSNLSTFEYDNEAVLKQIYEIL